MAGISDKALKSQYAPNRYRYNGKELQNGEFSDGSGLEEYDFGARFQDPQLGRWWSIDPLAEKMRKWSPYCYAAGNPMKFIDIEGSIIGNPDDPATKRAQTLLNKTKSGQELWVRMEASNRAIYFHNVNPRNKSNNQEDNNLLNYIKAAHGDAITMSKTEYANAKIGKVTDNKIIGLFNKKTGMYDKTSDWNETHVVLLNNGFTAASASSVVVKAFSENMELSQDEINESASLKIIGHEAEHTVQDDFDLIQADYNKTTGVYKENTNYKNWGDRKNEQNAESESYKILGQLFEIYKRDHPELLKPKKEMPNSTNN
jgi:RHS repeat-associated protein